jgi:hypothetical protein
LNVPKATLFGEMMAEVGYTPLQSMDENLWEQADDSLISCMMLNRFFPFKLLRSSNHHINVPTKHDINIRTIKTGGIAMASMMNNERCINLWLSSSSSSTKTDNL